MVIVVSILAVILLIGFIAALSKYRKLHKSFKESERSLAFVRIANDGLETTLDDWKRACWAAEAKVLHAVDDVEKLNTAYLQTKGDLEKVINQKKSSEVRTGLIAEQMAPFLDGFPYNPKDAHFLGKPVDFVVFDDKGIHFVEVKSGEAKLTDVQRRIKKDIEENRVTFEVYRISGG